jgi:hypothetical protein
MLSEHEKQVARKTYSDGEGYGHEAHVNAIYAAVEAVLAERQGAPVDWRYRNDSAFAALEAIMPLAFNGVPSPSHEGACGPDSGCDGICVDIANCAKVLVQARKALAQRTPEPVKKEDCMKDDEKTPAPAAPSDVPVHTLVNTGKSIRWVLESDHIAALAEARRTEPAPTPHPAGDVLRECMAIFNGPPDQPDGNGMNAVIKIARRGMVTLEQVEKAIIHLYCYAMGANSSAREFANNVRARLTPVQEQKEKQ